MKLSCYLCCLLQHLLEFAALQEGDRASESSIVAAADELALDEHLRHASFSSARLEFRFLGVRYFQKAERYHEATATSAGAPAVAVAGAARAGTSTATDPARTDGGGRHAHHPQLNEPRALLPAAPPTRAVDGPGLVPHF